MARNAIRRLKRDRALGCLCRVVLPEERRPACFPDGRVPVVSPEPALQDGRLAFTLDPRRLKWREKLIVAEASLKEFGGTLMEALNDLDGGRFWLMAEGCRVERCSFHPEEG